MFWTTFLLPKKGKKLSISVIKFFLENFSFLTFKKSYIKLCYCIISECIICGLFSLLGS